MDTDAQDNIEFAKTKLQMPVLAIGGRYSTGGEVARVMETVAVNVQSSIFERSGHWIAEEQPDDLLALLMEFFKH
jgi:pimeloyl-ACP methyl ester carboxylesterase